MFDPAPNSAAAFLFRLTLACDLAAVRPAAASARQALACHGASEEDLVSCELALVEACNNAIQYASRAGRHQPIEVNVLCKDSKVELRVADHTPGFEWPTRAEMPATDREGGRGLFFIQFLMDGAHYFRRRGENRLVMRKRRFGSAQSAIGSLSISTR